MADEPKRPWWSAMFGAVDRVTPARFILLVAVAVLIVLHGLLPKRFLVDYVTLGLLAIAVIVILVPLIDEATLPGGAKFRLRHELDALSSTADRAVEDQAETNARRSRNRPVGAPAPTGVEPERVDESVEELLREAERSPRVALISLSGLLERSVRKLVAMSGWETPQTAQSVRAGVDRLVAAGVLSPSAASGLGLYQSVRNEIVHGGKATDGDALAAIESGISLYRAVEAIPREHHVIMYPSVDLFSDAEGTKPLGPGHGVVLENISSEGVQPARIQAFPTTRDDHIAGREVTWDWAIDGAVWPEAWWRDPDSGEIRYGWTGSIEFRGRHLD